MDRKILLTCFFAGFLVTSFLVSTVLLYTIGAEFCEFQQSLRDSGVGVTTTECPGPIDYWISGITFSPVLTFSHIIIWIVSTVGGVISTGAAYRYLKSKG